MSSPDAPWAEASATYAHDLTGAHPASRPLHPRVGFDRIYPGIDVRYYGTDGQIEQDFEVAAGADPSRIRFRVRDGQLSLDADGRLLAEGPGGTRFALVPR